MTGALVPTQVALDGIVNGLVYALIGMGVVLVHRSTKVINIAAGAMGLPGAGLVGLLAIQYDVPYWLALACGLAAGTAFGAVVELVVVRRLFTAPRVVLLVATIGVAQLAQAIVQSLPDVDDLGVRYPSPIEATRTFGGVALAGPDQLTVLVVPLLAAGLAWLLTRTRFGRTVTASADNADLARLSGISPKRASTIVWTIAGLLSTVSLVLVTTGIGSVAAVSTLGPPTMARGLVVAVLAGMASFPRALVGGVVVGLAEAVIGFHTISEPGLGDTVLLLAVLVAVVLQSRRADTSGATTFTFTPRVRPVPDAIRDRWWVRHHGRLLAAVAVAVAAAVPLVVTTPSRSYLYSSILAFALVALSVSVITGWSGQLSLGQMALAGIGGLTTALLVRGQGIDLDLPGGTVLHLRFGPVSLVPAILGATACSAVVAVVLGSGALRVRGLLLAVSTFVFAHAAEQHLFSLDVFTGGLAPPVRVPRGELAGIDLTTQRTYYWLTLAATVVAAAVVAHLRGRRPGRAIMAVRDNADAASAYTVAPARTKLAAFAVSGAVAGLGGALLGGLTQNINTNELFVVGDSLEVVSMAVIGGLGSIAGPFLGALWVKGLPAFFPDNDLVPLFTSSMGLLLLLLYLPSGLAQLGYAARDAVFAWAARRVPAPDPVPQAVPPTVRGAGRAPVALEAADLRVRFGGVVAVDGASIRVAPGEVVGLIGTNGAGKSTVLNAVGGYVPSGGRVVVGDVDVTGAPPHVRARHGLGRTFQAAGLFPNLTVRETVMVALGASRRRRERAARAEADELLGFVGLGDYADHRIAELSTGTRRIVELAGLLAVDARVLCLDEPTAGVAQRESEAFGPLILAIRQELDASVLVVEHDMPLIMAMSDRVYCLEAGRVIAEGPPAQVRSDPAVIASYLGTDERAIARSDAGLATHLTTETSWT